MITEAQRRALFALREALHLCDDSGIVLNLPEDGGVLIEAPGMKSVAAGVYLCARDLDFLAVDFPDV